MTKNLLPASDELLVGAIQMVSSADVEENLKQASELIIEAAAKGCSLVVLPEYFCLFGNRDSDKLKIQETYGSGRLQDSLAKLAYIEKIHLVAGTIPLSSDEPKRVWNSSLVFNPEGNIIARYDKIHLFSFSQDGESYDESRTLLAGNTPVSFEINNNSTAWRFGLSICYDLRFPELYREIGKVDCQIIPAAFTHTTGEAHWEILLRARAIENQCYFLASAQGGTHGNGRRTWGHSLAVSPWGEIHECLDEGAGLIIAKLSKDHINDVRSKLPALQHRKQFK